MKIFNLALTGNPKRAAEIPAKDLGELIASAEEMIVSEALADHPDLRNENLELKIVGHRENGRVIYVSHTASNLIEPALQRISRALREQDTSRLADKTIDGLRKFSQLTKKYDCSIQWYSKNGAEETLLEVSPETVIDAYPVLVGETTIYGRLLRIGGKEPSALLEISEEQTLRCEISLPMALELAPRLYSWVGLVGTGKWNARTKRLIEFKARQIASYEETPLTEAFTWLRENLGAHYEEIDDPVTYFRKLRNEGDS